MSDQSSHPANITAVTMSELAKDPESYLTQVINTGKLLVVIMNGTYQFVVKQASGRRASNDTSRIEDFQLNPWGINNLIQALKRSIFLTRDGNVILEVQPLNEQAAREAAGLGTPDED